MLHIIYIFLVFVVARPEVRFIVLDDVEVASLGILPSNDLYLFLCFKPGRRAVEADEVVVLADAVDKLTLLFQIVLKEYLRLEVEDFTWDGVLGCWRREKSLLWVRALHYGGEIALLGGADSLGTLVAVRSFRVHFL